MTNVKLFAQKDDTCKSVYENAGGRATDTGWRICPEACDESNNLQEELLDD